MITPNIDRIGKNGVVFKRAYSQIAICGPSRASFLTGRRPQNTQIWNFVDTFRESHPDWISFPQYFKLHNYTTLGAGKTYHPKMPPYSDEPLSWSQEEGYYGGAFAWPPRPGGDNFVGESESVEENPPTPDSDCLVWPRSMLCPRANVTDSYFRDWRSMNATRARILRYANKTQPFFLAYGAHRPHLPWSYPQRFWDMYPETGNIALPEHEVAPINMPDIAFTYEMDGMVTVDAMNHTEVLPWPAADTAFSHNMTRTLRRGYYGAVTWSDFLIGELLDTLELAGVAKSTVVALVSDHGWQLGEHNLWGKHTNFELATRVPFIISSPDFSPGTSDALVELVDLYPTVASVAGLPPPSNLDGVDLSPLFNKTDTTVLHKLSATGRIPALKRAVFSEYPRCFLNRSTPWDGYVRPAFGHRANGWGNCMSTGKHWIHVMGYSVRTAQYRYTVWLPWDGRRVQADFGAQPLGEELYSHAGDDGTNFDAFENNNIAADPRNADLVEELFSMAKKQWDLVPPAPSPHCSAVQNGKVEQNFELIGESESLLSRGTSISDCCQQCGAAVNCSYFTFYSDGLMCRFFTNVTGLRRKIGTTSAALDGTPPLPGPLPPSPSPPPPKPKPPAPPSPEGGCMVQSLVCYKGNLLGYIPAASARACCSNCGKATGCTAFSFAPAFLRCSCLSNVTRLVDDPGCTSGRIGLKPTYPVRVSPDL